MVRVYGFYNRLLSARISYLYVATLFLAIMGTLNWWYFLYQPSIAATALMQQQVNQMQADVDELRKTERTLAGLSKSIDALRPDVQKKSESKMRKQGAQQALSLIADCAANSGASVGSCRLCSERTESSCTVYDVSGDFKGSFDQLIVFFDALKNSKTIIAVSKYELVHASGEVFALQANFAVYGA